MQRSESTKARAMIVDADECTGCRVCELICSVAKQGEFNPRKSWIRVLANSECGVFLPVLNTECDYCGECAEMCPPQALRIVDLGEAVIMKRQSKMGSFPIPVSSW